MPSPVPTRDDAAATTLIIGVVLVVPSVAVAIASGVDDGQPWWANLLVVVLAVVVSLGITAEALRGLGATTGPRWWRLVPLFGLAVLLGVRAGSAAAVPSLCLAALLGVYLEGMVLVWVIAGLAALAPAIIGLSEGSRTTALSLALLTAAVPLVALTTSMARQRSGELRRLRELTGADQRAAVAEERLRIARDLHDLVGHQLSAAALQLELAHRGLPAAAATSATAIGHAEVQVREALASIRSLVRGIDEPTLQATLSGVAQVLSASGITATIADAPIDLPADVDRSLARVVREAVTNVLRHSRAQHCTINISATTTHISVTVDDDGTGAPTELPAQGGLISLRDRLTHLNGTLTITDHPEHGTRVEAIIPALGSRR